MPERRITVAHGDGIGPEIMDATLRVLEAARAPLACDRIAVGEQAYRQGHTSGIAPDAWATIRRNGVLLKAPITTPQGGGYKSLNVTIRKALNLFATSGRSSPMPRSWRRRARPSTSSSSARTRKTSTPASSTSRPPT